MRTHISLFAAFLLYVGMHGRAQLELDVQPSNLLLDIGEGQPASSVRFVSRTPVVHTQVHSIETSLVRVSQATMCSNCLGYCGFTLRSIVQRYLLIRRLTLSDGYRLEGLMMMRPWTCLFQTQTTRPKRAVLMPCVPSRRRNANLNMVRGQADAHIWQLPLSCRLNVAIQAENPIAYKVGSPGASF